LVKFNPVKVLLIVCHPEPTSFTHAAASAAREVLEGLGHSVILHDLYAEGFDPVLSAAELARRYSLDGTVQAYSRELEECAGLLVFHPDWWGQPPAMLKGWVDRVLRPGLAYEFEGGEFERKSRVPLLAGKRGLVFCPSDSEDPESAHRLEGLWTQAVLGYCGMSGTCVVLTGMHQASPARRREHLDTVRRVTGRTFPLEAGAPPPLAGARLAAE
jgi:putative NADPH-quinone reductase